MKLIKYCIFFLAILLVDRLTKLWALAHLHVTVLNRGISWSLLQSDDPLQFALVTTLVFCVMFIMAWYAYKQYKNNQPIWAEVAVIAGASSNIIDRFWYGGVVDFILLEYEQWSWPLFNVADIVIVGGIIVMVFNSFWPDRKKLL